jgi:hypothetical protein
LKLRRAWPETVSTRSVRRDADRTIRCVTVVTPAAHAATLMMVALTRVALNGRREVDRQRAGAEGLMKFMLNDGGRLKS